MRAEYSSHSRAVRHLQQLRPTLEQFNAFRAHLTQLIERTEEVRKSVPSISMVGSRAHDKATYRKR